MRADALLENGATAGAATWRRIVKAVEELQRQERGGVTLRLGSSRAVVPA